MKGIELIYEKEPVHGWGVRIAYTFQSATATATNAFQLLRRIRIDTLGDTINPARVEFPLDYDRRHSLTVVGQARVSDGAGPRLFGTTPFGGLEAAAIFHFGSGLPYSRTNTTGDTLIGLPNVEPAASASTRSTHWCAAPCGSGDCAGACTSTPVTS